MKNKIKISVIILLLSIFNTSLALDNCKSELKNSSYNSLSSNDYEKVITFGENLHKKFVNKINSEQASIFGKYISILSNYKRKSNLDGVKLDIINLLVDQFQCKKEYVLKLNTAKSNSTSPIISTQDKIKYPGCDKENIINNNVIISGCKLDGNYDYFGRHKKVTNKLCASGWHLPTKEEAKFLNNNSNFRTSSSIVDASTGYKEYYYGNKGTVSKVNKYQSPYGASVICLKNKSSNLATVCDVNNIGKKNSKGQTCTKNISSSLSYIGSNNLRPSNPQIIYINTRNPACNWWGKEWNKSKKDLSTAKRLFHVMTSCTFSKATDTVITSKDACELQYDRIKNPVPKESKVNSVRVLDNGYGTYDIKNGLLRRTNKASCSVSHYKTITTTNYVWK